MRSWRKHVAYSRTGYPCVKDLEPDIDIDFEPNAQMKVYNYLTERYEQTPPKPTIQFTRGQGKGLSIKAFKALMETYSYRREMPVRQESQYTSFSGVYGRPQPFYWSGWHMPPERIWEQWFGAPRIRWHRDIISPQIRIDNGKEAVVINAVGCRLQLGDIVTIIGQPEDIREGLDIQGEAQYLVMKKRNKSVRATTIPELLIEYMKENVDIFSFHCTRFVEKNNKKMKSRLTRLEIL